MQAPLCRLTMPLGVRFFLSMILLCAANSPLVASAAFDHAHSQWDELMKRYVVVSGQGRTNLVDYSGLQTAQPRLNAYLKSLASVSMKDYDSFSRDQKLAFLINAYNAYTIQFVLTEYPAIDSIRDLGSILRSPWKIRRFPLLETNVSLDDIEHEMIREPGMFDEPRIHMALNCAAISCPGLRNEAYVADRLDSQLEDSTRHFLSDSSRNRADPKEIRVSRIFKWFREDFEIGDGSLANWLANYDQELSNDPAVQSAVRSASLRIRYFKYDWGLNDSSSRNN